jgi:hypothetical protein
VAAGSRLDFSANSSYSEGFREAFQSIAPSFYVTDLLVGIAIAVILA